MTIAFPAPPVIQPLHGLSGRFLTEIGRDHRWRARVWLQTPVGDVTDLTSFVTGGAVNVDEKSEFRRTGSVAMSVPLDLVPANLNDLLHPASSNELHVWRGVQYGDATTELAKLGIFRMTKPVISDDGQIVSVAMSIQDRASIIARIGWLVPYTVPAGQNIALAIQEAMEFIYPGGTYNFTNVDFTYPAQTFGASQVPGSGGASDPMADLITFAATAGCELFFDVNGVRTLRPIINPLTSDVVDGVHFVEGENCTMPTAQRTLDETTAYNGVTVYCNGTGSAQPFVVQVWDSDPGSPTYYLGPWGKRSLPITTTAIPAGDQSFADSKVAAERFAFGQLQLVLGSFDDISLTTAPNPALREGDCVHVVRSRLKIDNNYVISSMSIPLDPLSAESITFRPRISAT